MGYDDREDLLINAPPKARCCPRDELPCYSRFKAAVLKLQQALTSSQERKNREMEQPSSNQASAKDIQSAPGMVVTADRPKERR